MKFKFYEYTDQSKMPPLIESTAVAQNHSNGRGYFTIEHLREHQRIFIAGYNILVGSFLKRNYIFKDDRTKVSRKQLKKAHIFPDDGTLLVEGRLAFWDSIYKRDVAKMDKNPLRRSKIYEKGTSVVDKQLVSSNPTEQSPQPEEAESSKGFSIKGLSRTRVLKVGKYNLRVESILKRHYTFVDDGQKVPKELLREAIIFPDGTVTVNKRAVTWSGSKKEHQSAIKIGDENPITRGGFLKRTYYDLETGEQIAREALKHAQIDEDAGIVKLSGKVLVRKLPPVEQQISSYPLQPVTIMDVNSEEEGAVKRKWEQIGTPSNTGFFSLPLPKKPCLQIEPIQEPLQAQESEEVESVSPDSCDISPELWSIIADLGMENAILSQIGFSSPLDEEVSSPFNFNI